MLTQGSALINTKYFDNLGEAIAACKSCAELQSLVDGAFADINGLRAAIGSQMAALEPLLALCTVPSASPGAIVGWINSLIEGLIRPMTTPISIYTNQLAEIGLKLDNLQSLIVEKSYSFPSCTVTIPE